MKQKRQLNRTESITRQCRGTTKTTLPENARTHNWRFGATAALTPQKRQWENERLSPA